MSFEFRPSPLSVDSQFSSLLLGHGSFLPPDFCRQVVRQVLAHSWWQQSEVGEAGESIVDLSACRSVWSWLPGPYREAIIKRVASIGRALTPTETRPRCEEPIVLRYRRGGFFRRHRDRYDKRANAAGRRVSLIAFLTGQGERPGFQGGELRFYARARDGGDICVRVPGRTGQFVVFGAELEHEVLPVLAGERLTLVSWLY